MHFLLFLIPLVSVTSTLAAPIPVRAATDNVIDSIERRSPATWYHQRRHPVHSLFRRATSSSSSSSDTTITVDDGDTSDSSDSLDSLDSPDSTSTSSTSSVTSTSSGTYDSVRNYPAVGSAAWADGFPTDPGTPDPNSMPQDWLDALNAAVKAGKIPNIPKSSNSADMSDPTAVPNIKYPSGTDPKSSKVCSSSFKCKAPGSLWDAPDGYFGIAFENGPTTATDTLLNFLSANEESATHFMIGVNILKNPAQFKAAFNQGDDIAVNTWSHPVMTTLSNEEIVAEIGWTMQLIHNSTGGRVPRFWRPPYGDSDTRVQAIAHEVFGLRTVMYNTDTEDWQIDAGIKTADEVDSDFENVVDGNQSPGIIPLEHETTDGAVQAFIRNYPKLQDKGWKTLPVSQLFDGLTPYQNVQGTGTSAKVTKHGILLLASDAGDNLKAPVGPSAKVKQDNGGIASVATWSKSSLSQVLLVSMAVMFVL